MNFLLTIDGDNATLRSDRPFLPIPQHNRDMALRLTRMMGFLLASADCKTHERVHEFLRTAQVAVINGNDLLADEDIREMFRGTASFIFENGHEFAKLAKDMPYDNPAGASFYALLRLIRKCARDRETVFLGDELIDAYDDGVAWRKAYD